MKSEQLKKMVQDAFDRLVEDVEAGKSEALVQYLKTMGRFHMYSVGNMVLIALQKPDATKVAGYSTWTKLNRYVREGQKGIAILAPLIYRKKIPIDDETNQSRDTQTREVEYISGMKVVHVFDISQTTGAPLVEPLKVQGNPGHLLDTMKQVVKAKGIELRYDLLPGSTLGLSCGGIIVIKAGMSPSEEFSVIAHEFAHELLHRSNEGKQKPRKIKEIEAEAVAFVVNHGIGLETGRANSDYIQLYHGDKAALLESLERIQKTACEILWALKNSPRYVTEDYRAENESVRPAEGTVSVAA